MAIELCSDSSGVSPRISFSHDLCISDIVPIEQNPLRRSSLGSLDFDFCVRKSFDRDSSSADELFSDGKILPTEIKKKNDLIKQTDRSLPPPQALVHDDGSSVSNSSKRETMKETKSSNDEAEEKQSSSKSFWRFKRSSSLNCGSGYGRSLCPLPLLSRSYSTGSTPSVKRGTLSKDVNSSSTNHKHHKQPFLKPSPSSSSTNYQKPPLKNKCGSYGHGVRVSPVLNVPSGNLFGFGSIFFNGKDKNKKK